ncbi:MAG: EF-P 5-aminopentanol modification-associated protein YfmH [Candidatus Howiella sp.]|jgi:predicted Zn-dependent peptidase
MKKTIMENTAIGEKYIYAEHESGLKIYICPKEEYASSYAMFGTKYGSIDTKFSIDGGGMQEVPAGIAHFLEHKLFESEDGDAFTRYAKTGASANAYTSFDRTCYLFSCSDRFEESFDILLDFVQSPYFTKETVDKEQGIIGQEIRMYDDSPSWRVLFNMLEGMFQNHPVKIDIAGTVESIAQIDADLLYRCYNAFYNLNNMFICVAGKVDPDRLLVQIEKGLKPVRPVTVERGRFAEQDGVNRAYISQDFAVAVPLFCLGFKEKCARPERTLKEILSTEILLDLLIGPTSPLYERLIEEKWINANFDTEYFNGHGYAVPILSGESTQPERVRDAVFGELDRLRREGLDPNLFEAARRAKYGRSVMQFNNVERIASGMVEAAMTGSGLFEDIEVLQALTLEDVADRLDALKADCAVLSVVRPSAK